MFGFLDRFIEKKLKQALHKRRKDIIVKSLHDFIKTNSTYHQLVQKLQQNQLPVEDNLRGLYKKLDIEADRVYAIADRSLLRARIKQAKWAFWGAAIISVVLVGLLGAFSHGTLIAFVTPAVSAFTTWFIGIATIPITYDQRVKAGMDTVSILFESELQDKITSMANTVKTKPAVELLATPISSTDLLNILSKTSSTHTVRFWQSAKHHDTKKIEKLLESSGIITALKQIRF